MNRPNILIFMTDHQRADTVLPEHPCLTPNLDKFLRQSVTFTETYCPSPHCCPSRATFHSGQYPSRHGVWNNICNDQALSRAPVEGTKMFSEDLSAAGYRMIWSGKWHVSVEKSPKDYGWGEELLCSGEKLYPENQRWERYKYIAKQPEKTQRAQGEILRPGWGDYPMYGRNDKGSQHDEKTLELALEAMGKLRGSQEPWAMFVGAIMPHDPYMVPGKYLDLYDLDNVPLPESYRDTMTDKPRIYQRMRRMRWGQLSEREIRDGIRHYWAMCTYLDDMFGQLLAALDAAGQADNTLVLYTSDHGDYAGEHGLFAKGIPCFRGAYNVPAVVRWPGVVKDPGRRVDEFVSLADFAPTFLDAAGCRAERKFSGASLAPFLRGEKPADWRDATFTQCDGVELYFTQRSVATKKHKYVFNGFDEDELYDLTADPLEMRNVAEDPKYATVKLDLSRRLWRFAYEQDDRCPSPYITIALAPHGPAEAFRE